MRMAAVILVSLLPALLVSGADGKKPARTKKRRIKNVGPISRSY